MTTIALGNEENAHFAISSLKCFPGEQGWWGLLTMRSGSFALIDHEFYFDDLPSFQSNIRMIYDTLEGSATLRQRYERDHLAVRATARGRICVKGHFETTPDANRIDIEFSVDQTYLPQLISTLQRAIKEAQSDLVA